jgi:hypothetical protein
VLRAATSLTHLLKADNTRRAESQTVLAPIYEGFTEGFETRDLRAAKASLTSRPEGSRT